MSLRLRAPGYDRDQTLNKKQPYLQRPWTGRDFRDFAEKNDANGRSSML